MAFAASWRQRIFARLLPSLNRLIWRRLPPVTRRMLATALGRFTLAAAGAPAGLPIYVVGFLSSATGQGQSARLNLQALRLLGYPVTGIDLSAMFELADFAGDGMAGIAPGPGTVLFNFNPEALVFAKMAIGARALRGKRIIGYWAWETARIPRHWVSALALVDEVWAPSRFTADAITAATSKPVRVVPHPVAIAPAGRARRSELGIGAGFTVLALASFHSTFDRKNPLGAIAAFRQAFADSGEATLILKLAHGEMASIDQRQAIRGAIGPAANIVVREDILDNEAMRDLIASVDVVLSLHRAEGFGLVMAEAMQAGVPVVATAWSGNLDFMDAQTASLVPAELVPALDSQGFFHSSDVTWAEPSISAAAASLRQLAAAPAQRAALAERARRHVDAGLGLPGFRDAVAQSLPEPG